MNEYRPINRNFPPVIKNLIIINALCWLASMTLPRVLNVDIVELFGLHYWGSEAFKPYQLVTYMFLHDTSSFSHLLFNMFGLWMFGKDIELFWGKNKFLILLSENPVIKEKFSINKPIKWSMDEETLYPYYAGNLEFEIPIAPLNFIPNYQKYL